MSDYRISLRRDDVLFAEISVSRARYEEMTREMRKRFPREEGFSLHIEHRREFRRILEQGPDGLRLLGIEYRQEEVSEHA